MRTHYFVKLTPRRPRFGVDMTPEEKTLMEAHAAYWGEMMKQGHVHVFGPVMDDSGMYGMGVVNAESPEDIEEMLAEDPARPLMTMSISPMQAYLPA